MAKYSNHPLVQRWAGFLAKIDSRLDEIIAESEAGLTGLREQDPADFMPFTNAMSGLDARVRQLDDKIDETWEQQVEPKFEEALDSCPGIRDEGIDMKSLAEFELEWKWARFKTRVVADFYRNLAPLAEAAKAQTRHCSQCATPLQLADRMSTQSVKCPSCGAVNQIVPEPELRAYAGAPSAFAAEQTDKLREEIARFRRDVDLSQRAKRQRDDYSGEGVANLERWEKMERAYWTRHAELVAHYSGTPVDMDLVTSRMKSFYQYTLEMDQEWTRVHGKQPR